MAEPIDLAFGLWTRVVKHKLSRIRQVAPMCPHGRAHWRHVGKTIEQSVCCSDTVLRQITLTTCLLAVCSQVLEERASGGTECVGILRVPVAAGYEGSGRVIPVDVGLEQLRQIHRRLLS